MDVRCEQCKTEYEFDDARVTEAGVTVKCTTCGHVFKVKKKALVVTLPVNPAEAAQAVPAAPSSLGGGGREWKVRQPNGNIFSFRELTTLQKWIVERKVSRDDEISLTGESWKRLGNIAELASFFQVVEEAQKAAQLEALAAHGLLGTQPGLSPPPAPPPGASLPAPGPMAPPASGAAGGFPSPGGASPPSASPPSLALPGPAALGSEPKAEPIGPSAGPSVLSPPAPSGPLAAPRQAPPRPNLSAPRVSYARSVDDDDDVSFARSRRGVWVAALLFVVAAAAVGYYVYSQVLSPPQGELTAAGEPTASPAEEVASAGATTPGPTMDPSAAVVSDAGEQDAGIADGDSVTAAAAALPDAGPVDAGASASAAAPTPAVVPAAKRPEPARDFDWYMNQADRLRERERSQSALDLYGKAADLQPTRAEPVAGRGLALLDLGKYLQAEASFQEALKLNSRYGVALMGLAETYKAQGKKEQAIEAYQRYLDVLPNGPEANVAKAAIQRLNE